MCRLFLLYLKLLTIKKEFIKKIVLSTSLVLMGTFAFANNSLYEAEVESEIECREMKSKCGEIGIFCWFKGEPIDAEEVEDFDNYMCNN